MKPSRLLPFMALALAVGFPTTVWANQKSRLPYCRNPIPGRPNSVLCVLKRYRCRKHQLLFGCCDELREPQLKDSGRC